MPYTYEYFQKSADFLKEKVDFTPEIAIILGSCLGPFAQEIENPVVVDYKDIPNFLVSTVASHAGKLIFGTICGRKVVCMSGRFHSYEGYDFEQLVIPIRVFKLLGVKTTILTNAAGAVNRDFSVGDIMLITDHIKLFGVSPLCGANVDEFGPRFPDMSRVYTPALRDVARQAAKSLDIPLREGVYMYFPGPQYETPAEVRAARLLGADAVGMSTVPEAIVAGHCGMQVLGFTLCTNMAAGVLDQPLDGEEVIAAGLAAGPKFTALVKACLERV